MDCRAFEKNLEEYLQDGLDFPLRFHMERHSRQCIFCGKKMADALRLRQLARELERVKAPSGFESAVLNEIAKRGARAEIPFYRKFWIYGIERPILRNSALAALSFALVIAGTLYLSRRTVNREAPAPSLVAVTPEISGPGNTPSAAAEPLILMLKPVKAEKAPEIVPSAESPRPVLEAIEPEMEHSEAEYVEHIMPGPDNRPMTIRLPKAIRVKYGQTSEEYFIRNVSH